MARGRIQTLEYTVPANNEIQLNITGDTIAAFESNGSLKIEFDNDGVVTEFVGGIKYPDEPFKTFKLINEGENAITIKFGVGLGKVDDARLSVSSALSVQNVAGQSISVRDSEARSYLFHLRNSIDLIADAQSERNGRLAISPKVDLNNSDYAKVHNTTTTVVTAAENTDGVIIRTLCISARGANGSYVRIGGDDLYHANPTSGDMTHIWPEQILVPAGQDIEVAAIGSNSFICMKYEVL